MGIDWRGCSAGTILVKQERYVMKAGSAFDAPATPARTDAAPKSAAGELLYVCDSDVGIRRQRHGKSFTYRHDNGHRITNPHVLERIRKLAIPPAYADVWICAQANGHLQATGRDARGRKQYRYHVRWHALRDRGKFDRVIEFGTALPHLRRRLRRDLALPGLPRDKVLALLISVMAETLLRIGNEGYTRENHSYGLTTLRNRHVQSYRGRLQFQFRGKSGQMREAPLDDKRLIRLVRRIQQLPGQRLFQYIDDEGARHPIDSDRVNDYLREASAGNFTAKDFRTFGGTVQAAAILARTPIPDAGENAQRSALACAVKQVATRLGNTPAVCRNSYIHPDVPAGWLCGHLHAAIPESAAMHPRQIERHTLAFLRSEARHRARAR
jgi:DNA topoisomerase-1